MFTFSTGTGKPFASIVQSKFFTFHVGTGEQKDEIHTYSEAIAATSDKMRALMEGGMKEAGARSAVLEDVETEDFIRYYEYAIRGDYTVPSYKIDHAVVEAQLKEASLAAQPTPAKPLVPVARDASLDTQSRSAFGVFGSNPATGGSTSAFGATLPASRATTPALGLFGQPTTAFGQPTSAFGSSTSTSGGTRPAAGGLFGSGASSSAEKTASSKKGVEINAKDKAALRTHFITRDYLPVNVSKAAIQRGFDPKSNTHANEDFTPIFLAHARLYTFADFNLVAPLKNIALYKLHQTLMMFQLFHARIGDIIELAKYAYDNNHNRKQDGTVDKLRQLVVEYMAYKIDIIGKSKEWVELMEEGGEFVIDFWRVATEYHILA